jgi:prefoldin subunit 5
MKISNVTIGLLVALGISLGSGAYLKSKVDSLGVQLEAAKTVAQQNAEAIEDLRGQYMDIEFNTTEIRANMDKMKVDNEKLRKDAKKANVVASKPGLVEKQINRSFNSFAEDFRSLSE